MKKILILAISLLWVGQSFGQWDKHSAFNFLIKPHTANTITIERDSIGYGIGRIVGAIDKVPSVTSDSLFYLTGTAKDTSFAIKTFPYMSFLIALDDTSSAGDSSAYRIKIHIGAKSEFVRRKNESELPPPFGYYALVDSVDISNEVATWWNVTASSIPVGSWFYLTCEGLAGNKKTSAVSARIIASFYDDTRVRR